jgi:flagellin
MIGINSFGVADALKALQTANTALAQTTNQVSTGKRVATVEDDPAAYVIAQGLRSDVGALTAVNSSLGGAEVPTRVAAGAIDNISNTLIKLKESVIAAQSGGIAATAEDTQMQSLISQISSNVTDATVNGVNLISGAVIGDAKVTQIAVPSDINGHTIVIGDKGLSGMNASVAGLGLVGFPSNNAGLTIKFVSAFAGAFVTADPATQIVVQTGNYGNATADNPQYPAQKWTFQFTDAATPVAATRDPTLRDAKGNVLQQDNLIPVPLKPGFTLSDVTQALQQALSGEGFESKVALLAEAPQLTISIAGNNIDQSAVGSDSVVNLNVPPTANGLGPEESLYLSQAAPIGATSLIYDTRNAFPASALLGGMFFSSYQNAWSYIAHNPYKPAIFYNFPVAEGTTVSAVDPTTNTLTLSGPTTQAIASGGTTGVAEIILRPPPEVVDTPWTGIDADIATIDSAMRKIGTMSQYLGNAQNSLAQAQTRVSGSIDDLNGGIGNLVDADMGKVSANLVAQQIRQQLASQSLSISDHAPAMLLQLFK